MITKKTMNEFEKSLKKYLGIKNLKKIQRAKIGIAGAGGLGSNCAFNLVRSGFKKFVICDYDAVEIKNLNRQFYFIEQIGNPKVEMLKLNLMRINSDINIKIYKIKLDETNIVKVFKDCNVIIEAFDKAEYKRMIIETFLNTQKLLISASGIAGIGSSDEIRIHKIKPKFYIIGDLTTEVSSMIPPFSPRVNIAAAKQADIILEYIINSEPASF